jgi:hypothetical protein
MTDGLRLTLDPDPPVTVLRGRHAVRLRLTETQADALVRSLTWTANPDRGDREVVRQVVEALTRRETGAETRG